MPRRAQLGPARHPLRPPRRARRARASYSSAADVTRSLVSSCGRASCARPSREQTATISGGRTLHTWDDLLAQFPADDRREDRPHRAAGWCQVAAARGRGITVYATLLGSPARARTKRRPRVAPDLGPRSVSRRPGSRFRPCLCRGPAAVRPRCAPPRRGGALLAVARLGPPADRDASSRPVSSRCRFDEARCSDASRSARGARLVGTPPARRRPQRQQAGPGGTARVVRRQDAPPSGPPAVSFKAMIVTVTLNAAIDRTLTVPNFQRGQRHRASAGVTLAGGKGINVARALKTLGVPVVATGLVGGADRDAHRRAADRRGDPQRLRAHRRRVAHFDRGRRPDRRHLHRDQRVGTGRSCPRSSRCCSRSSAT